MNRCIRAQRLTSFDELTSEHTVNTRRKVSKMNTALIIETVLIFFNRLFKRLIMVSVLMLFIMTLFPSVEQTLGFSGALTISLIVLLVWTIVSMSRHGKETIEEAGTEIQFEF